MAQQPGAHLLQARRPSWAAPLAAGTDILNLGNLEISNKHCGTFTMYSSINQNQGNQSEFWDRRKCDGLHVVNEARSAALPTRPAKPDGRPTRPATAGKEANVYHATGGEDNADLAIKVYKTSILVFKDRDRCAHARKQRAPGGACTHAVHTCVHACCAHTAGANPACVQCARPVARPALHRRWLAQHPRLACA